MTKMKMPKMKMPIIKNGNEKTKIIVGIGLIFLAMFLMVGVASAYIINNMSTNNNGVNKTSTVKSSSGGSNSGGGFVSGGVKMNNESYGSVGNYRPYKGASAVLNLIGFSIQNKYTKGQDLYNKIFLLDPNTNFNAYATFDVTGANIKKAIIVRFYLEQGSLPGGSLHHLKGTKILTEGTKIFANGLALGKHTISIPAKTPGYNPGHDWYLPYITAQIGNTKNVVRYEARMDNDLTNFKWLTLQYENEWCIPKSTTELNGCLHVSGLSSDRSSKYVTISITQTRATFNSGYSNFITNPGGAIYNAAKNVVTSLREHNVKNVIIYEITYPGKYVMVYDGEPVTSSFVHVSYSGTTYKMSIPKSSFATVTPNEAYLKIRMTGTNGQLLNLNNAPNDKAARINIPIQVIGSTPWRGTKQYFDSIGIISFDTLGGSNNISPESQYFISIW